MMIHLYAFYSLVLNMAFFASLSYYLIIITLQVQLIDRLFIQLFLPLYPDHFCSIQVKEEAASLYVMISSMKGDIRMESQVEEILLNLCYLRVKIMIQIDLKRFSICSREQQMTILVDMFEQNLMKESFRMIEEKNLNPIISYFLRVMKC